MSDPKADPEAMLEIGCEKCGWTGFVEANTVTRKRKRTNDKGEVKEYSDYYPHVRRCSCLLNAMS